MASGDPFTDLVTAFSVKVADLKEIALLRIDDAAKGIYAEDLEALEATVRAMEAKSREIRACIQREKEAIPKVQAAIAACRHQHEHLAFIAAHLPPFLPAAPDAEHAQQSQQHQQRQHHPQQQQPPLQQRQVSAAECIAVGPSGTRHTTGKACGIAGPAHGAGRGAAAGAKENVGSGRAASAAGAKDAKAAAEPVERKQRPPAPRRFVTQDELSSLSSYMRGRLTLDKVNAAVDEAATLGEATAKLVATVRRDSRAVPVADRKRAQTLLHSVMNKEGVKGRYWFMDADVKDGALTGKTGKTILTILRHLGRLQEVRINVAGVFEVVHVLQ